MVDFSKHLKRNQPPTMHKLAANISASQYKTWKMCRRKWAFGKVWGIKEPSKQHFVIGHAFHAVAERYITAQAGTWEDLFPAAHVDAAGTHVPAWDAGLAPDESAWIQDMIRRGVQKGVLQADPGSQVEVPIAFLTPPEFADARGLPLLAKAEVYLDETLTRRISALTTLYDGSPLPVGWDRLPPFVGFIDQMLLHLDPPRITDHKTAKSRRYAATPKKLAEDEQVLSYAALPLVLRPDVTQVMVRHNINIKEAGGPDPYCVEVPVTYEKVLTTWNDIRQSAADMQLVREIAPKFVDAAKGPAARANNWQLVKSAVEEGRAQDACSAYGGCPFKDICFGRATAEQVVRRLDAPPISALIANAARPTVSSTHPSSGIYRLNIKPKDSAMVFGPTAAAAPKLYQDVYVLDPENATHQYRARVSATPTKDGEPYFLALYPLPDVTPNWATLPSSYQISVPKAAILVIPHATAKVSSYYQALIEGGVDAASIAWSTAEAAGIPAPGAAKMSERPAPDGQFKLNLGPAAPQPAATQPAAMPLPTQPAPAPPVVAAATAPPVPENPPLVGPLPSWVKGVTTGMVLVVNAGGPNVGHSYWGKPDKMGKHATVYNILPGDQAGTVLFDVTIDGDQHPNVDSRRFLGPVAAAAPSASPTPMAQYASLVGKLVVLTLKSIASPLNVVLEAVTLTGATVLSGQRTYPWEDITSIVEMTPASIPGSKEAVKAEALQTAVAAIDPSKALEQALEAVQAALNGGKVTKKVVEGILPLLVAAKAFQAGAVSGGTPQDSTMAALVSQEDVGKIVTAANDAFRKLAVLAFQQAGIAIPAAG